MSIIFIIFKIFKKDIETLIQILYLDYNVILQYAYIYDSIFWTLYLLSKIIVIRFYIIKDDV